MHDLVIRGGYLVDGGGGQPLVADIAVDDGTIAAIGQVHARGREEIDAREHVVTPGFVDLHTHLDAQIGWDPFLTPLPQHGVTTALMGNCGMTFAPVRSTDHALLAEMMEAVEDIPAGAITAGLPWSWESYGEYLDCLETLRPGINVAGMVGHCAVRFYVMGERAVDGQPDAREIDQMAAVVAESLAAGAVGFSTSRLLSHLLPDGRAVPGTHAHSSELIAIARKIAGHGGGLFQAVPNLDALDSELALIAEMARVTGDRALFSITADALQGEGPSLDSRMREICAGTEDITATTYLRGSGVLCGLVNTLPWQAGSWQDFTQLGFEERLAGLHDPALCARLIEDAECSEPVFSPRQLFWLGEGQPDYSYPEQNSLQTLSAQRAEHPATTFLRLSRESQGRVLFMARLFNACPQAVRELVCADYGLPTLGDAGAHVGLIMDAGWCTFLLSQRVREDAWFSLAEGVRRMTSAPARLMGLKDRGRLQPGFRADINVIDLDRLGLCMPEFVHDFPGGTGRFSQNAKGYRATICNGRAILVDDELTGARAGQVLRN